MMPETTIETLTALHAKSLKCADLEFKMPGRNCFDLSNDLYPVDPLVGEVLALGILRIEDLNLTDLLSQNDNQLCSKDPHSLYLQVAAQIAFCFNAAVTQARPLNQTTNKYESGRMQTYAVPFKITGITSDTPLLQTTCGF